MFNFFKKKEQKEKKVVKEKTNYIKYTKSATLDTLDFVKKTVSVLDIINQSFYIAYVTYRLILQMGYLAINIILLILTVSDLVFQLSTLREFYTKEQRETRKIVRVSIKWVKRTIRIILITLSIVNLVQNAATVTLIDLLMTLLMIFGFIFSIVSDVVLKIINNRMAVIRNAFYYDIEEFKKGDSLIVKIINKQLKEVLSLVPEVESEELRAKLEEIYKSQNEKTIRKHNFHLKYAALEEQKEAAKLVVDTDVKSKEPKAKDKPKEIAPSKNKDEIKKLK